MKNDSPLPKILNETINLLEKNKIICNIDNPFKFVKKDKENLEFENDFLNEFIRFVRLNKIRLSTFHLNKEKKDVLSYEEDVLIAQQIDLQSLYNIKIDTKQIITYLRDLILKPFAFLWNFMRKITKNELLRDFEELLKLYF